MLRAVPGECIGLLRSRRDLEGDLLAQLAKHAAGAIVVTGEDPLFEALTVAANVTFPLRRRSVTRHERDSTVTELLAVSGLDGVASNRARGLDRATHARVVLARALAASRPLLLDDVLDGVPPVDRSVFPPIIRHMIKRRRAAVVMVTSDRAELFGCADRIGVIEGSHVPKVDTPAALFHSPGTAFAAQALLDAQLFPGHLIEVDADEADVYLACGAVMPARAAPGVKAGDLCLVGVAPAQIAFAALIAADMGGQAIAATLIEARNLGDHLRLRMRLEDGYQIWVRRPAGSLTTRDIERASEPLGASLAWRSSQATAYPIPRS